MWVAFVSIFTVVGLVFGIVVLAHYIYYTYDTRVEEWIYTFPKNYPELKPLACELAKKGKLTWTDKMRFSKRVREVQDEYIKRNLIRERQEFLRECGEE